MQAQRHGLLQRIDVGAVRSTSVKFIVLIVESITGGLKPWTLYRRLVVSVLLLLPLFQVVVVEATNEGFDPNSSWPCSLRDARMDPTYEKRYGVDVVWQIPPKVKAILFLAHASTKDALQYFDPGPNCQQCYGLPEDRTVVLEALRLGYAVIVVKSLGIRWDTEWPIEESKDLVLVPKIMKEWTREHSLEGLPLAAWGVSSGTFFASALTFRLPMQALVLMCGEGIFEVEEMATPEQFPPTFFVYMPVDKYNAALNVTGKDAKAMAILSERGVEVADTQCWPKPLSPLFFTERILCMSDEASRKIFATYQAAGWLDSNGYLIKNPRVEDWKSVLWEANALPFCAESGDLCLAEHVEEELNMAFAEHTITSDSNDAIFPWLASTILSSSYSGEESILQRPPLAAAI